MKIKCIECNLHWNVSVKEEIHPKGYICPWCIAKINKMRRETSN